MDVREGIEQILNKGGEIFIRARDKRHAESMRVSAFNIRRRMPSTLKENVGIQAVVEDNEFFLRLFDKEIDGAEVFILDQKTGELIPDPRSSYGSAAQRIANLMRKDGKTDEEINNYLKGE